MANREKSPAPKERKSLSVAERADAGECGRCRSTRSIRAPGRYTGNHMTVHVPWEPLGPGPTGQEDRRSSTTTPPTSATIRRSISTIRSLLANDGLDPSESDPRFHQQMVYAIAVAHHPDVRGRAGPRDPLAPRRSLRRLGRDDDAMRKTDDIRVLKLYPHAMQQANAYLQPAGARHPVRLLHAPTRPARAATCPARRVFTCLSQDIIAHEVTHAVIDGIRTYFTEPTNPDVLAFHEGFADLCALFATSRTSEALIDAIRRTGGRLYQTVLDAAIAARRARSGFDKPRQDAADRRRDRAQTNPLVELAKQFGRRAARERGLRSGAGHAAQLRRHPQERRRAALPRLDPGRRRVRRVLQHLHAARRRPVPHLPRRRRAHRTTTICPRRSPTCSPRCAAQTAGSFFTALRARPRLLPAGRHHVRRLSARPHHASPGTSIRTTTTACATR